MRLMTLLLVTAFIILPMLPMTARAGIPADIDTVRLMLTAPDNQDLSIFEPESLIIALVDIALNDSVNAAYHESVVRSALVHLGKMHAPEAVDVLILRLDGHTTTCIYWLGTYAVPEAVEAIVPYLESDDASVRHEAATALGSLPEISDDASEDEIAAWNEILDMALAALSGAIDSETDPDVRSAIIDAIG